MKATAGPWTEITGRKAGLTIDGLTDRPEPMRLIGRSTPTATRIVCAVPMDKGDDANFKLVAAAPELSEALRSTFNCLTSFRDDLHGYADGAIESARAALEKAGVTAGMNPAGMRHET